MRLNEHGDLLFNEDVFSPTIRSALGGHSISEKHDFGGIFGGGSPFEGSVKGQGTQQISKLTKEQERLVKLLTQQATPAIRAVTGATIPGQDLAPAGLSQLQQQGLGLAGGFAPGVSAGLEAFGQFDPNIGGQFLGQAQGALQRGLQGFDPQQILSALEPGRQLAQNQFNQQTVPDLLERFGAGSGASGSLNRALAEAGANLSLGLGAQAAPFLGQAALQAPGQQFQGAQLAGQLSGIPGQLAAQGGQLAGQGLQGLLGAGGLQQQQAQLQRDFQLQRFQAAAPEADPRLGFVGPAFTSAFDTAVQQGFFQPSVASQVAGFF
jgi:hypothetical protein